MILRRLAEGVRQQDWFTVVVEVLIVVVGIFLGLQVDDWNEARKKNQLEQEYLSALSDNISASHALLREHTGFIEERLGYLEVLMEPGTASDANMDSARLEPMVWRGVYWINNLEWDLSVYEELKSSGQLAIIQDAELRQMLSRLELLLNRTRQKEAVTIDFQMRDVAPYMQPLLNTKLIFRHKADWDILPESWQSLEDQIDWVAMLGDPEVQDLLAGLYLELGHQLIGFAEISSSYSLVSELIKMRLSDLSTGATV